MRKTKYIYTFIVIGVLMALALLGTTVVEFVFTCGVLIGTGGLILYTLLVCTGFAEKVIDAIHRTR